MAGDHLVRRQQPCLVEIGSELSGKKLKLSLLGYHCSDFRLPDFVSIK